MFCCSVQSDKILMQNFSFTITEPPSRLRRAALLLATIAMAGLALIFSVLLIAVILIVGATAGGYLWWKTRNLRRQMREFSSGGSVMDGEAISDEVIEGEVIRVADTVVDHDDCQVLVLDASAREK